MSGAMMSWETSCCRCSTGAHHWLPCKISSNFCLDLFCIQRGCGKHQRQ